jgi:hypothetical protein
VLVLPSGITGTWGPDATELAARNGLLLDEWQESVLDGAMSYRVDGSPAADKIGLIVARQNGKNAVLEARELYGLTVQGEWIIHTSHLFTTTKESFNRLLSMIEADPDTKDTLTYQVASPASGYEMRFRSGGRIKFIARSRTSGRGLTGDLLVFDEAQDLNDDALGALLPTISARPRSQTWYQGSAPGPESTVWQRIRKRGRTGGDDRLTYLEWSADPEVELDDRDAWVQANPSMGQRPDSGITITACETERGQMSDEMFARERLSVSPDVDELADRPWSAETWEAVNDAGAETSGRLSFALDVNPERSAGCLAVSDGSTVEVVAHLAGVHWILDRVEEVAGRWGGGVAIHEAGPAGSFIAELEQRNVRVERVGEREFTQACGMFFDAVTDGNVRVRRHPALTSAANGARKKLTGDAWKWARRDATVDVSPLVAVTLAYRSASVSPPPVTPHVIDLSELLDDDDEEW